MRLALSQKYGALFTALRHAGDVQCSSLCLQSLERAVIEERERDVYRE